MQQLEKVQVKEDFIEQGQILRKKERFKDAIALCQRALELYNDSHEFYVLWGQAAASQGNCVETIEAYTKAIEIESLQPAWLYKGLINNLKAEKKLDEAIKIGILGLKHYPNNTEILITYGAILALQGKRQAAIKAYSKAIKIESSQPVWLYKDLISHLKANYQLDKAINIGILGLKHHPNNTEILITHGAILALQEKLPEATEAYNKAIKIKANQPVWVYCALLNLLKEQKKFNQATTIAKQGLIFHPENIELLKNIGSVFINQGKLDEAIQIFKQGIELDDKSYECYHFLGEVLSQKDELDTAANFYSKATEINPNYCWSYYSLGIVLLRQEKFNQAIACFNKAIEIEPKRTEFHDKLRLAREKRSIKKISEPLDIENLIKHGSEPIYSRIAERFGWQLKTQIYKSIPPQKLIKDSGSKNISHYVSNTLLFTKDLIQQCMLKRNANVLEIGCGVGRIANGLLHYLNKEGSYWGIDVNPEMINWCHKYIHTRRGNFKFQQIPVINNYYYEKNNNKLNKYDFSFLDNQKFDCVVAMATFNHLRMEDTQKYLQEISSRLKPNGVAYLTFFIIDQCFLRFQQRTKLYQDLQQEHTGIWYGYELQSSFTGYEMQTLKEILDDANLKIITYHPGKWAQKKRSRLFQDWMLVERK